VRKSEKYEGLIIYLSAVVLMSLWVLTPAVSAVLVVLQTKSVRDLARLSLDEPEYLAVHSEAAAPTPLKLKQAYMVVSQH